MNKLLVCFVLFLAASLAHPEEVSVDGLQRLQDSVTPQAWIRPGVDLGAYRKIVVQPIGLTFKDVPRTSRDTYEITEEQKAELRKVIPEALGAELAKLTSYELASKPGRDVLVMHSAVLDIVSHTPPEPVGRGANFVRDLGEATLVVELRDSMTDEVVARAIDRRSVSPAFVRRSTAVFNHAEVRSAARRWAFDLRRQLEEFARL